VQEKLTTLQQLVEAIRIVPEQRLGEGPTTSMIGEAGATTSYLTETTTMHIVLKISAKCN
jgi:hypothetical protein